MKIKSFLALPLLVMGFLLSVESVRAEMVITEIAWMGVSANSSCEFIELYNDGDYAINMTDWTLSVNGSTPKTFTGSDLLVEPGDFRIIERVNSSGTRYCTTTQLPTSNKNLIPLVFQLTDSGVSIAISNIDILTGLDWDNFATQNDRNNRSSLQRTNTGLWVLSSPTPGSVTTASANTAGLSENNTSSIQTATASGTIAASGIQGIAIDAPAYVSVGVPITFTSKTVPVDARLYKSHEWNFGDGDTSLLSAPVHTYKYPGTYMVYLTVDSRDWEYVVKKSIVVTAQSLTLSRTVEGDYVVTNTGSHDTDLSYFTLASEKAFTFPKNTTLVAGGSITIAQTKVDASGMALYPRLSNREGTVLASYEQVPPAATMSVVASPYATAVSAVVQKVGAPVAREELPVFLEEGREATTTATTAIEVVASTDSGDAMASVVDSGFSFTKLLPYLGLVILFGLAGAGVYSRSKNV